MTDGHLLWFEAFQFSSVSQLMKLDSNAHNADIAFRAYLKRSFDSEGF